jgi:hypothetical protein
MVITFAKVDTSRMDVDIPKFKPNVNYYSILDLKVNDFPLDSNVQDFLKLRLFPYFESVNVEYLSYFGKQAFIGRDNVVQQINTIIENRKNDKYEPIIISTSRGMGKKFLLKCVGSQNVDNKCALIGDALLYGRVLSFDFAKEYSAISNQEDIYTFFPLNDHFLVSVTMEQRWMEFTLRK